jgi:hypothetical protein
LTAVLASPAFSQATPMLTQQALAYSSQRVQPGHYSGNAQRGYVQQGYVQGYAPGVVNSDRIVGHDPDPNVRLELRRDPVADY